MRSKGNLAQHGGVMNVVKMERAAEPSFIERAAEVLALLNMKTGKKYAAKNPRGSPTANAEVVMHRLKEGYTVDDLKAVIALKYREWAHDERMSKCLTPETLFRRSNFERYVGEIGE
jgi:uncharacterized phage protein (TIGR02220 family)